MRNGVVQKKPRRARSRPLDPAAVEGVLDIQKKPKNPSNRRMAFGRYIVADPKICHGKFTFAGTRIFVADVLEMVAQGMDWDDIIVQWHSSISKEAISEAVLLAGRAFLDHAHEYEQRPGDA